MTKRQKLARVLRKWADLIDPRHDPTDGLSISVDVDTSVALARLDILKGNLEKVVSLINQVAEKLPCDRKDG